MIRSLTGTVTQTNLTNLVLSVQGVGYLIHINTLRYGYEVGDQLSLHTYLAVRETALDLYGFPTTAELAYFELLLDVPKIGPKSALQIMGQADTATLTEAIRGKDASLLHKLSGIGKKTAENIVQYLHDKLDHLPDVAPRGEASVQSDRTHSDAIDALISLGYPAADARSAVRSVASHTDTNDLLKQALRELSRN